LHSYELTSASINKVKRLVTTNALALNTVIDLDTYELEWTVPFVFETRVGQMLHGSVRGGQQAYVDLARGTLTLK
ncbi:MAG TPA: hypothetical protein VF597_04270, partial [Candidatus Saccharimonadales bacterium]|jgi:hypothetical protein